jgi:hypothetical protein
MKQKGDEPMKSMCKVMTAFMEEYFRAYSEYAQVQDTQPIMDKFYAPELSFDDGSVTSREQWYQRCLAHPAIQDKLTVENLFTDEKKMEALTLLKTQAVDRATGTVLLELKMCVLYGLKIDSKADIKITKIKIFLETDFAKINKLSQLYMIK